MRHGFGDWMDEPRWYRWIDRADLGPDGCRPGLEHVLAHRIDPPWLGISSRICLCTTGRNVWPSHPQRTWSTTSIPCGRDIVRRPPTSTTFDGRECGNLVACHRWSTIGIRREEEMDCYRFLSARNVLQRVPDIVDRIDDSCTANCWARGISGEECSCSMQWACSHVTLMDRHRWMRTICVVVSAVVWHWIDRVIFSYLQWPRHCRGEEENERERNAWAVKEKTALH